MKKYLKIIKNDSDYENALNKIECLIGMDPEPGSNEGELLDVLALIIKEYEDKHYKIASPTPIEAIKFRMEQMNLTQKDLVPYIGSRSKVSEILNSKRQLNMKMVRALNKGLGIPYDSLMGETKYVEKENYKEFPIKVFNEMFNRNYFDTSPRKITEAKDISEELLIGHFGDNSYGNMNYVRYRRNIRAGIKSNDCALMAWQMQVLKLAKKQPLENIYNSRFISTKFIQQLVSLSTFANGVNLAKEFLNVNGIHLIILPHLIGSRLDGAAFKTLDGEPIISLTLRYDRIDNFWFTLLHELGHIKLHCKNTGDSFLDDLDVEGNEIEKEADEFAHKSLISDNQWKKFSFDNKTKSAKVIEFAKKLNISSAIVAGKVRHEIKNYRILTQLLGQGMVRNKFGI